MPKLDELVPEGDLPLSSKVQRFKTHYVHGGRDLKEAACKAGLDPIWGAKLWAQPKVREAIEDEIAKIDELQVRESARARQLATELIDSTVVHQLKRRKDRVPADVIKIAYGRVGLLKDGEFYMAPDLNQPHNQPSIYQRQTTAKRTVTEEVTQTVTVVDPIFAVQEY